jgi:hypothetical protein
MAFYVGSYLIQQDSLDLKHDSLSWELPDTTALSGHMGQTSNVEELLINPEDMTLIPTQIQFGIAEWSADEGFEPDHEAYKQFYVRAEAFYVRGFTPVDYWTPQWYPGGSEFYTGLVANLPGLYTPMWYPGGGFYVRSFTPRDYWQTSWYASGAWTDSFYAPADEWSEFYPADYP